MQTSKTIELHGKPVANGKFPLVCAPLVARQPAQLLAELQVVLAKRPDMLEWRVDFFEEIGNAEQVINMASAIRAAAAGIPLLFTRRSPREGGEKTALSEKKAIALYQALCDSRLVDLIDFEMSNDAAHIDVVRKTARVNDIKLILSFHNFSFTPALETLEQRFLQAEQLGADIAKVAVMPRNAEDVLTLLGATLSASQKLTIPLISIAMGPHGSLTRLFGWAFGSALTFATGAASSAPGQMPIEDLNTVLAIVQKSLHTQKQESS